MRIVSLVPSWTETLFAFGVGAEIVGRTEWCVEPAGEVERVPGMGGTKNPDVDAILAARPDLVVVNREENRRDDVERLDREGVPVIVTFARTVREAIDEMGSLAPRVGHPPRAPAIIGACRDAVELVAGVTANSPDTRRPRVFCPIWRDPWMTINGDTYIADVLRLSGADNVFEERERRYPLAADLGRKPDVLPGERDTRYPRVAEEEIVATDPELVLLPSEPYAFGEKDAEEIRRLLPHAHVALIDGRDLSWYGVRIATGLPRVRKAVENYSRL